MNFVALSPAGRSCLLEIARGALLKTLTATASEAADPIPANVTSDPDLNQPAGCFVSLHDRSTHRLRGCVGRLDPTLSLWNAVQQTTIDVLQDPRFASTHPVTAADVNDLEVEVSV